MPKMFRILTILFLSALSAFAATYHSDGSAGNVQALCDAAVAGDTVTVPAGTFTWTTPVVISNAVTLQGAGVAGNRKTVIVHGAGLNVLLTLRSLAPESITLMGIRFVISSGGTGPLVLMQ